MAMKKAFALLLFGVIDAKQWREDWQNRAQKWKDQWNDENEDLMQKKNEMKENWEAKKNEWEDEKNDWKDNWEATKDDWDEKKSQWKDWEAKSPGEKRHWKKTGDFKYWDDDRAESPDSPGSPRDSSFQKPQELVADDVAVDWPVVKTTEGARAHPKSTGIPTYEPSKVDRKSTGKPMPMYPQIEPKRAKFPHDKKPYEKHEIERRPHDFDNMKLEKERVETAEKEPLFDLESEEILKNFFNEMEDKNGTRRHLIRVG